MVVSEEAAAAGVASIPDPDTNTDGDWLVWQSLITSFAFGSDIGFGHGVGQQYVVDSKAMRKVGNNKQVAIVVSNSSAVGGIVGIEGRMLVKLH